ncbi:MAG: tetratricopeptide repeat protein, partial [Bacteroidales bacterium]|nr:tetratricopeptide repeat protein [Bacteroidales bacterium]
PDDKFEFNTMLQAGLAYKFMEKYDETIKTFTNFLGDIVNEDNWPLCRLEIAHCHRLKENFDTAIDWYLDIIDQHPKTIEAAEAYFYLGKIYQEQKAEYEFAKEYYDKAPLENSRSEKAKQAQAKSKGIKQLLELQANIIAQQKRIAKGDSIAAVVETMDIDEDNPNRVNLEFTYFDTLVAHSLEIPLDSLSVYQDTLMSIYKVKFTDYDTTHFHYTEDETETAQYIEIKLTFVDTLIANSLDIPLNYLNDYQDSLRNVCDRFYHTYKKNELLYEIILNQNSSSINDNKTGTPMEVLVSAKLSLAEIFLFEFNQPDSALKQYIDVLEIDTSREVIPKTLYSIGYIAETFNQDTLFADSMFQRLIIEYPDDPLTQHARKKIKTIKISDPEFEIAKNFSAAEIEYFDHQNYEQALKDFDSIQEEYPASDFAPKSLLTMGWIYENNLNELDSAFQTYQSLIDKYPNSVFAKQIKNKVDEVKRAESATEKSGQVAADKIEEIQLAEAEDQTEKELAGEVDIASMDTEQYRRYLISEMAKNDPRRTTPRRW